MQQFIYMRGRFQDWVFVTYHHSSTVWQKEYALVMRRNVWFMMNFLQKLQSHQLNLNRKAYWLLSAQSDIEFSCTQQIREFVCVKSNFCQSLPLIYSSLFWPTNLWDHSDTLRGWAQLLCYHESFNTGLLGVNSDNADSQTI